MEKDAGRVIRGLGWHRPCRSTPQWCVYRCPSTIRPDSQGRIEMANIVLVHGAWHGGWCYRHTAAALRKMGHEVFTPTHTGVGERAHQADENITLETHIRDVAGC